MVGNPNTGKTTYFNSLTNSNSHTGNWHGVTIEPEITRASGYQDLSIIDLAGTYSLNPYSLEETKTANFVLKNRVPVINICEQKNLHRNLMLALQLFELGVPMKLVVNTFGQPAEYDEQELENALNCPACFVDFFDKKQVKQSLKVLPKAGQNNVALDYLKDVPFREICAILQKYEPNLNKLNEGLSLSEKSLEQKNKAENITCTAKKSCEEKSRVIKNNNPACKNCAYKNSCKKETINCPQNDKNFIAKFVALRLIEGGDYYLKIYELNADDKAKLQEYISEKTSQKIYELRYKKIAEILKKAKVENATKIAPNKKMSKKTQKKCKNGVKNALFHKKSVKNINWQEKIDKILLNKYLAIPIFLIIILLVFYLTFSSLGALLSSACEWLVIDVIVAPLLRLLEQLNLPILTSLFSVGIVGGVGSIVTFLPQVLLLFLFLTILEESGYMARLAYLLEGICNKVGLSGKSVFTFLMGFGCTATALMTAENLENKNAKLKTVLCTPFMSCSAKLPVFAVLGGAFFGGGNVLLIFALYVLSSLIGIAVVNVLDKTIIPPKGNSFLLEFPPYRIPTARVLAKSAFHNTSQFLARVGTYILIFSVIIWFLQSFSLDLSFIANEQSGKKSILQCFAEVLAPLFAPLGFGEWGAVSALLAGLVAKELIVSSIGIINSVGSGDVSNLVGASVLNGLNPVSFTPASVLSFLVFCLLYTPCIATISAMRAEIGWKWTAFSVAMQLCVAYVASLLVYNLALLFL